MALGREVDRADDRLEVGRELTGSGVKLRVAHGRVMVDGSRGVAEARDDRVLHRRQDHAELLEVVADRLHDRPFLSVSRELDVAAQLFTLFRERIAFDEPTLAKVVERGVDLLVGPSRGS